MEAWPGGCAAVLVTAGRAAVAVSCPAEEAAAYRLGHPHPGFRLLEDGRVRCREG